MDDPQVPPNNTSENDILARFQQVERQVSDSWSDLRAVQEGDSILFQIGKGCRGCTMLAFTICSLMFLFGLFAAFPPVNSSKPSYLYWAVAGTLLFLWLWVVWSTLRGNFTRRTLFAIHTTAQELVIYPWPWQRPYKKEQPLRKGEPEQQRLALEQIELFIACWDYGVSDSAAPQIGGALFALGKDGKVHSLTDVRQQFAVVEKCTQVVGFICDKLAVSVAEGVDAYRFVEVVQRGVHNGNRDKLINAVRVNKDRLMEVAITLHVPAKAMPS